MNSLNSVFTISTVCLFTSNEDGCSHPECLYRKTAAQTQRPKAISNGMLAGLQAREERGRFREQMALNAQRNNSKLGM